MSDWTTNHAVSSEARRIAENLASDPVIMGDMPLATAAANPFAEIEAELLPTAHVSMLATEVLVEDYRNLQLAVQRAVDETTSFIAPLNLPSNERDDLIAQVRGLASGANTHTLAAVISRIREVAARAASESGTENLERILLYTLSTIEQGLSESSQRNLEKAFDLLSLNRPLTEEEQIEFVIAAMSRPGHPMSREEAAEWLMNPSVREMIPLFQHDPVSARRILAEMMEEREGVERRALELTAIIRSDPFSPEADAAREELGELRMGIGGTPQGMPFDMEEYRTRAGAIIAQNSDLAAHVRRAGGLNRLTERAFDIYSDPDLYEAAQANPRSADGRVVQIVGQITGVMLTEIAMEEFRATQGQSLGLTEAQLVERLRERNPDLFPPAGQNPAIDEALNRIAISAVTNFNTAIQDETTRTRVLAGEPAITFQIAEVVTRDSVRAGRSARPGEPIQQPIVTARVASADMADEGAAIRAATGPGAARNRTGADGVVREQGNRNDRRRFDGLSTIELEFEDAMRMSAGVRGAADGRNAQEVVQRLEALGIIEQNAYADNRVNIGGLSNGSWDDFGRWNNRSMGRLNTNTDNDQDGAQLGLNETRNALNLADFMSADRGAYRHLVDNDNIAGNLLDVNSMRNAMRVLALADDGADGLDANEIAYARRLLELANRNRGGVSADELRIATNLDAILRDNNFMREIADGLTQLRRQGYDVDINNDGRVDAKDVDEAARVLAASGVTDVSRIDEVPELRRALGAAIPAQSRAAR